MYIYHASSIDAGIWVTVVDISITTRSCPTNITRAVVAGWNILRREIHSFISAWLDIEQSVCMVRGLLSRCHGRRDWENAYTH